MTPRLVGVALIGCGRVTESRHLPALQSLADARVVALADTEPDRLARVAARFQIEHRYEDFLDLLADPAIQVVGVCVPPHLHARVALKALEAGKHVLIEKPLALSLEECDRLIERAGRSPGKVMVGFNLRWHRLVHQARDIIREGTLGPLEVVRTVHTSHHEEIPDWRRRRELGGGVLFEQAIHHFDLWRFLLQSEVEEVFATSRSEQWDDVTAAVTARLANGVVATSVFCERTTASNDVEIYGRAGRLLLSCYRFDGLEFRSALSAPSGVATRLKRAANALRQLPQSLGTVRRGGDYRASFHAEWQHFIEAIRSDTPVGCSLEDGKRAVHIALAAMQSASLGGPVNMTRVSPRITPVRRDPA